MPSPVKNFTNTPPGSPANGDRYVCGTSPTGAWSGQANKYATYLGSAWEFRTPIEGDLVYDQTADTHKVYDGSAWNLFTVQINSTKDSVRVASTANVTISSPGSTIDGVSLSSGDRVLLKDQSTGSQNGIYLWNGAASAMTRATDFDTSSEVQPNVVIGVQEGTANADKRFQLTTNAPITLATAALTFAEFGGSGSGGVTVKEEDGSPSVTATEIKFPNGSLTNNGGGSVSVAFTGGSSAPFDFYPFGVPASPDADDQEFQSGAAPGTDFNIGSVTVTRGDYGLKLACPSNSSAQNVRGRVFAVTLADGEFVYTHVSTDIHTLSAGFVDSGLALVADTAAPTTTAIYTVSLSQAGQVYRQNHSNKTTQSGSPTGLLVASAICRALWLGISRSGTSYTMWASLNGLRWYPIDAQTIGTAPNGVLLFCNPYSLAADVYFRHLRFRTGVGPTGAFQ